MKGFFAAVGIGLAGIALIVALAFGGPALSLAVTKVFGPLFEETRREIAEESRTHVRGVSAHIIRLGTDLEMAGNAAHQRAIARQIISEAGRLDESDITPPAQDVLYGARRIYNGGA